MSGSLLQAAVDTIQEFDAKESRLAMKTAAIVLIPVLLLGCVSSGAPPAADSSTVPATAELSLALHWVRNSAEYQAAVLQTSVLAADRLRMVAPDRERNTWAVAIDADETILDNSSYALELVENDLQTSDERWGRWVARRAAPPLPGAIEFLELVHDLGGRIAVVTNRRSELCADTEANFRAFEIPYDVILCRQDDRRKEGRWQAVENGQASADLPPLEIVMWLGDNIEDFPELHQGIRLQGLEFFEEFGRRFFVMPNPTYGSWLENPRG